VDDPGALFRVEIVKAWRCAASSSSRVRQHPPEGIYVVSSGLLLTAWIIGLVFEIPSRWMHVLPVLSVIPMVVHVV
jgi:hypothetical protein